MSNKNCTIKTFFPTFIAAEINKKILTLYSRVESEVGSEEIFVLFRPDDARVAVAVVVAIVVVLVIDAFVVVVVVFPVVAVVAAAPDIAVVVVVTDAFVPSSFDVSADVGVGVVVVAIVFVDEVGIVAINSSEVCN